ncbi:MAG TPA: hypothetical protein VG318_02430 [Actinomycetota bacterium]|nr:hypothetical protein [Actinomycetota bacterium]
MRKILASGTAAAVLFVAGIAVADAGKNHGDGPSNRLAFQVARAGDTTTSDEFVRVTGLTLPIANAKGPVAVTFNGDLAGAPAEIRVRVGTNGPVLGSGPAHFDPSSGTTSFSFTFAANLESCAQLEVEWRSSTGEEVELSHGSVVAEYRRLRGDRVCL